MIDASLGNEQNDKRAEPESQFCDDLSFTLTVFVMKSHRFILVEAVDTQLWNFIDLLQQ